MRKITFGAARRRYETKQGGYWRISKLRPSDRIRLGGNFALLEGTFVRDVGDLDAVMRWCREAGVLLQSEVIVDWPVKGSL